MQTEERRRLIEIRDQIKAKEKKDRENKIKEAQENERLMEEND